MQRLPRGPHDLTRDEVARYSRHLIIPNFGVEGQKRLRAASVLVIGAGGLGAPVLNYLAAAGIGSITIIDDAQPAVRFAGQHVAAVPGIDARQPVGNRARIDSA